MEPALLKAYETLKKVRESKSVELKPTTMFRKDIVGFDGKPQPLKLRYYQVQGIFHLLTMQRMVLGDGTGLGKCKSAKSLVLTEKGLIPLGSLAPVPLNAMRPDTFYPVTEPVRVWTGNDWTEVKSFYYSGRKPARVVRTDRGYTTDGSLVHPLWVRDSLGGHFKPVGDLKLGDWVAIDRSGAPFPSAEPPISGAFPSTFPSTLNPELAGLLGWLTAGAVINTHAGKVRDEVRERLETVFGEVPTTNAPTPDILAFLTQCGVRGGRVPRVVFQGTRESVREFLGCYFEEKGVVVQRIGMEVETHCPDSLRDIQQLLLRFGIVSALSLRYSDKYRKFHYFLTLSGLDAWMLQDQVGFLSIVKHQELGRALEGISRSDESLVPHIGAEVRGLLGVIRSYARGHVLTEPVRWLGSEWEMARRWFKAALFGSGDLFSYAYLSDLLCLASHYSLEEHECFRAIEKVVDQRLFYDRVSEIVKTDDDLMDLEVVDESHTFVADGFINHNTIQAIGALCYLWDRNPAMKALVVCPKSAIRQWASEVDKFTMGVTVFVGTGSAQQRHKAYRDWAACKTPALIALNYQSLVRDWDAGITKEALPKDAKKGLQPALIMGLLDGLTMAIPSLTVIFDEASAFKNPSTKTHQTCKFLGERAQRVWGLTATLLKNRLEEAFGIYKVVRPQTFTSKSKFLDEYCKVELQRVKSGARIPIVVGYKNLDQFRALLDPFFYGRAKHVVSDELPSLTTREILCELSPAEDAKYIEALSGLLELGDGEIKDYQDTKELTSLIYVQEVCNSLALLGFNEGDEMDGGTFEGRSAKEKALVDLLTEEMDGEKVIVYTRFEKLIGRLQGILTKERIKSVRITGTEKDKARKQAQDRFQDMSSPYRVCFISDAGSEAINLQAASALVFFDAPWSWGAYVQILGRMIRIGSPHQTVYAIHLVAERMAKIKKRDTIDHKVLATLRSKKGLIDQIIGEAAVGALRFERDDNTVRDMLWELRAEARAAV